MSETSQPSEKRPSGPSDQPNPKLLAVDRFVFWLFLVLAAATLASWWLAPSAATTLPCTQDRRERLDRIAAALRRDQEIPGERVGEPLGH